MCLGWLRNRYGNEGEIPSDLGVRKSLDLRTGMAGSKASQSVFTALEALLEPLQE